MSVIKLSGKGRSHGYATCTTISGATESSVCDLEGYANYGLLIPAIDTGTVTFKVSNESGGTYYIVKDKDASTSFTISSTSGDVAIESDDLKALAGYRYIKCVTATQTAPRTFIFTVKG